MPVSSFAEDTFLLLDALEADVNELGALKPLICLEIGSGSGCVSSFAGSILGPSTTLYLCTDINPHASFCTSSTGTKNKIPLNAITTSFAHPFLERLKGSVDLILFNPPYVPTEEIESSEAQALAGIQGSWAGGADGMQVANLCLPHIKCLLSPNGRFYLVALKQNNIPEIQRRLRVEYGLESEVGYTNHLLKDAELMKTQIALERRAGREHLFIMRCNKLSETPC